MLKVIEVTNKWCGVCKAIEPMVKKAVEMQGPRIQFEKVEIEWDDPLAKKYNIVQMPTFLFLDGDKLLYKHTGAVTIPVFNTLITNNLKKIVDVPDGN